MPLAQRAVQRVEVNEGFGCERVGSMEHVTAKQHGTVFLASHQSTQGKHAMQLLARISSIPQVVERIPKGRRRLLHTDIFNHTAILHTFLALSYRFKKKPSLP